MSALVEPRPKSADRSLTERIVRGLNRLPIHIALGIIALIWLAPTVGLLVTSFRPRSDIQVTGWWESFLQFRYTLENYTEVLGSQGMLDAFVNTLMIAIPSTIIPLTLASMAAYAFSWLHFPFRDGLFLLVVALLMIPLQVAFIPLLKLFAPTGLLNSYGAIWLTHTAFALPFGIFLLRNFFISLPRDLIEAARIDGASSISIFRKIVVPLSVPAIAAYGIFQFLWVWNDLLMAVIFIQRGDQWPMTKAIQNLLTQYGTEWHLLAAGAFILMAVPMIVFFALQRFFVQGLLAGSVK
jgi:alpha-glucoside transport system permease protein